MVDWIGIGENRISLGKRWQRMLAIQTMPLFKFWIQRASTTKTCIFNRIVRQIGQTARTQHAGSSRSTEITTLWQ